MKKTVSFVMAICLLASMLLLMTSCLFEHPIDQFREKIEKSGNNFQMAMTIELTDTIKMTQIVKTDGNIQYTVANKDWMIPESYTETLEDGTVFEYTKDAFGVWSKAEKEDESALDEDANDLFNSKNYEKVDGEKNTYRQKDDVIFEKFEDVVITIGEDSCTVECVLRIEGVGYDTKVVYSKIGEMELTLPEVGSK